VENILPDYERPLKSIKEPSITLNYWDEAKDAFDEKKYKKSLIAVINYLNIDILKDVNTSENIVIKQMHGSSEVNIHIDENCFKISIPFLKIGDNTNKVALLRKVSEVNFSRFDLAQIVQDNEKLTIEFESPLALCQPYKIYTILREVCFRADEFDDEFIENYAAEPYDMREKKELTQEEQEKAWLQIDSILQDYEKYALYFKEKQWENYQWDIEVITLLKIANMPYVNGILRHELMEHIDLLFNGDKEFTYRVEKGRNYIKKLMQMSKEEFLKNLYHSELFISMLWRSSDEIIKTRLEEFSDTVIKYDKEENAFAVSYYLEGIFLKLIYNYNLEPNYKNAIESVLEECSGLKPEESAPKLLKLYYAMYKKTLNENIDEFSNEKEGMWSKISTYLWLFFIMAMVVRFLQGA